jgi:molecular chaperone DnaK (HSP70)
VEGWEEDKEIEAILLAQNNLIQDSEEKEENGYPVLDSNKTKRNDAKEPNYAHKNNLKEEILQIITKNFMEVLLDTVNQNVQEALKKFQDTKNKECKKTHQQINELIGALNKHQSETENTINREINELKMKTDNTKKKVIHDMEILRKKNETITKHNGRPFLQTRPSGRQNLRS